MLPLVAVHALMFFILPLPVALAGLLLAVIISFPMALLVRRPANTHRRRSWPGARPGSRSTNRTGCGDQSLLMVPADGQFEPKSSAWTPVAWASILQALSIAASARRSR
jgi:hypothetical protein